MHDSTCECSEDTDCNACAVFSNIAKQGRNIRYCLLKKCLYGVERPLWFINTNAIFISLWENTTVYQYDTVIKLIKQINVFQSYLICTYLERISIEITNNSAPDMEALRWLTI